MIFACGSLGLLFASLAVAEDKREALAKKRGVHAPRRRIAPCEDFHSSKFVSEFCTSVGLEYLGPLEGHERDDFHKIEMPDGAFNAVRVPGPQAANIGEIISLWTHSTVSARPGIESFNMMLTLAGHMLPIFNPVCKIVVSQLDKDRFGDDNYHMVDPYGYLDDSVAVYSNFQVAAYVHTTPVFVRHCSTPDRNSGRNDVFLLYDAAERALDKEAPGWQPYTALWR